MYRTDFWTLWEKARVGCSKGIASKHVYYLGWNRSPAQVGCMRQVLGPGALGRPRGIGWRGMWEWGLGWGIHVYPRLIHVNVWQKPLQYCKVISLQLIKKNKKKNHLPQNPESCDPYSHKYVCMSITETKVSQNILTFKYSIIVWSFPGSSVGKECAFSAGEPRFDPWVEKIPWRRKWQTTPVLPGKSRRQRSLVGYSPWSHESWARFSN